MRNHCRRSVATVAACGIVLSLGGAADAQPNVALGKPVVASSVETPAFEAAMAVDGDTGTRWSSEFSDPNWIYVDLEVTYGVDRVVLRWETAYGKSYEIQLSPDASAWTTAYSTTSGDGAVDDFTFTPASGRYVRMYGTERGTTYGYSLYEFEVYGFDTAVTIQATDPVAGEPSDTGQFTVTRDGDDSNPLPVDLDVRGDAIRGLSDDYTLDIAGNTVVIPAGETSVTITVDPVDDLIGEIDEDVVIEILPGAGYNVGMPKKDTVTIHDDDVPGTFQLTELNDGTPRGDGATEVNELSDITLDWSDPSPVAASSYRLVVARNLGLTDTVIDDDTLTAPPSQFTIGSGTLSPDTTYYWQVTAVNVAGETPAGNGPWRFTTTDTIEPYVSRTDPDDGDDRVNISTGVRIFFSEPVNGPGGPDWGFSLEDSLGEKVTGSVSFTDGDMRLKFSPEADLKFSETYKGTLDPAGWNDLAGTPHPLKVEGTTFTFTTFDELTGLAKGEGCVPGPVSCGLVALLTAVAAAAGIRSRRR